MSIFTHLAVNGLHSTDNINNNTMLVLSILLRHNVRSVVLKEGSN